MSALEQTGSLDIDVLSLNEKKDSFSILDVSFPSNKCMSEDDTIVDNGRESEPNDLSSASGDKTTCDEESSQGLPNGLQNGAYPTEEHQSPSCDYSNEVAAELQPQSSQDVTNSLPDCDKEIEDSSTRWSDGDSSPGRLQIDAEDVAEPVRSPLQPSDDDADPNALTIDTGEARDVEEDLPKEKAISLIEPDVSLFLTSSNVDKTIESVATGNVSPTKVETKMTIPLKRRRTFKRLRRSSTFNRLVLNGDKPVKKRHISSLLQCPRCPMRSFNTVSALLDHQRVCGSRSMAPAPMVNSEQLPKTPRKVYMCSACGSYFENWDLFVHMKEEHKRHICLYCLGMFSQASKLAQHLAVKHGIMDQVLLSGDDLAARYPGPHFLLCCRCDRMCTDRDFESHSCSSVCSHCGLAGTHYPTCRLAPPVTAKPSKTPRRRSRVPKKVKEQRTEPTPEPLSLQPPIPSPTLETPSFSQEMLSPVDELSPTTFNERMLQLYRGSKPSERNVSSMESIEETINRVVEESCGDIENKIKEEFDEETITEPMQIEKQPSPEPEEELKFEEEDEQREEAEQENEPTQGMEIPPEEPEPNLEPETELEPDPDSEPASQNRTDEDTSDSEKLTIALEHGNADRLSRNEEDSEPGIVLAGEEIPYSSVPLTEPLNVARVPIAMKLFVRCTSLICVYCAHARKIAVNGKQLALHLLAQHRYITVAESAPHNDRVSSHATVVRCLREALPSLESVYFNAYGYDSSDKSAWRSADRIYECFHCCFSTADSKEFLSHNRKTHQNASHLCIMCKTRFLSYSELLCHLCGGIYIPGRIIDPYLRYRCYACDMEPLPSSFQLMVHLRRIHTACDMCFVLCDSQAALFAHVQKHKFLFYCYACALTYRTRQEITKHIFWKHGAESVTCKRCLQKKWRHAYHFCLPPPGFTCDECAGWFTTASALRVHKRLHQGIFPHVCSICSEKFITKKLLTKHAIKHEPPQMNGSLSSPQPVDRQKKQKKKKEVTDLFDLPPVNLSESDDSSDDENASRSKEENKIDQTAPIPEIPLGSDVFTANQQPQVPEPATPAEADSTVPGQMWDGVLASLEGERGRSFPPDSPFYNLPLHRVAAIMLADHDYCRPTTTAGEGSQASVDHDYCNNGTINKNKEKSPRKVKRRTRSSSSDSSSSSSSSCSCGSNCSCSSSSSSTESATSGEPKSSKRKGSKGVSKPEKLKEEDNLELKQDIEVEPTVDVDEARIQESDLETDESVTDDEEFYEKNPALRASEVLRKNRSMLLDKLEGTPLPSQIPPNRKQKSKKKRSSPAHGGARSPKTPRPVDSSPSFSPFDDTLDTPDGRRPRRKRVPLKFYGFSSGEEEEFQQAPAPKKRERVVEHNTTIPAPPQPPAPPSPETSNLWNPPSWRPPPVAPKVNPIKIRTGSLKQTFAKSVDSGEFTITRADLGGFHVNGAAADGTRGEKLYCFCQCPYDEVSEMIACDAVDCRIEWFHFECVGIMVPPKGKWFCPECKKKAAAESELMGLPLRPA